MPKESIHKQFERFIEIGRVMPKQTPDKMLIAYGFYKQALVGDCVEDRPKENSTVVETFMHDSWKRLKGMPKEEAMGKYIEYIKELLVEEKLTVASFSK